jgi:sirohydrochlorin ferrochelatase
LLIVKCKLKRSRIVSRLKIITALSLLLFAVTAFSQTPGKEINQGIPEGTGILLLAHGGSTKWNEEVLKLAAQINKDVPVEVAFGMATRRTIQEGIDKLSGRGVKRIVAVPLFISSHSSVITSTEYLLGQRQEAPPALAIFAKMDHSHSSHGSASMEASPDGTKPVKSPVPLHLTSALDRDPLVAEILITRAASISREPAREVVILVAHGPTSDENNAKWLADMKALADLMRPKTEYKRIEYLTVRDDAPEPIRANAAAELRARVETATGAGDKVLIVPLLLSYGGIEQGIKKRLEGLDYTITDRALLPDERLALWVKNSVIKTR